MTKVIIFDWVGTLYERDKGPFAESKKILEYLTKKGYSLFLISLSKDTEKRHKQIESSGLSHFFNKIIIDNTKTEEQYLECIKESNSKPEETIIIDDRTIRGISLGNKIGCQTYWIQKGEYTNELPNKDTGQPTKIIKSISELFDYL